MKTLVLYAGQLNFKEEEIVENNSSKDNGQLAQLQNIVGGNIEIPNFVEEFSKNNIDMIINEEGKLIEGLEPSIFILNERNDVVDVIMGNVIFAGVDDEGSTVGITDEQINIVKSVINAVTAVSMNDKIALGHVIKL